PPGGGMITVAADPEALAPALAAEPEVVAAALNGPADTVLSGPLDALARIGEELTGLGFRTRELASPYAFHSALMAPVAAGLRAAPVDCAPDALPVASTRYGRMLRDEPMDAEYWAGQTEEPVLFDAALGALVRDIAPTHLVEIGPQPQLTRIAARAGSLGGAELLHPAPGPEGTGRDLAETVAALYRCGLDPDWEQLYAPEHRVPEPLAPYVFSSAQRYWDRPPASVGAPVERRPEAVPLAEVAPDRVVSRETESDGAGGDDPVLVAVVEAVTEVGGYPTERVVREARFHEDLGFDSVMIMQLKNRVEARLPRVGEVSVQQMLPALRSVGSLAEFLDGVIMARSA
ncbi:acyltransferase domain-containing protein, partial [Streptomyces sp. SID9124]|uniref:acyltransferase domain-containing protein n=1 Tax=Streptomyces sp. SID9124 TaxID=2706108 RepID=UPI0013DEF12D